MIFSAVLPGFDPDPSICRVGQGRLCPLWRGEQAFFAGAFVAMIAFDNAQQGREAQFGHFTYRPKAT